MKRERYERVLRGCKADFSWPPEDRNALYVFTTEYNGETFRYVYMLCPCGCGITLPINVAGTSPGAVWELTENADGSISLSPSIAVQGGCNSHFFIRNNEVIWA